MDKFNIITEHSLWWIFPLLVCSVFLSLFLYKKAKATLSPKTYFLLVFLRALLIFSLLLLFINPLINHFKNKIKKPQAVLILDDSQSLSYANVSSTDILNKLVSWRKECESTGIQPYVLNLDGESITDTLSFSRTSTNLDQAIKTVLENFEGENLASITLLTDGIVNQGMSPYYSDYGIKINVVGLGDTSQVKDASIFKVNVNKVSFTSKKIPLEVIVSTKGIEGKEIDLRLKKQGDLIANKTFFVKGNQEYMSHTFYVQEEKADIYPYNIELITKDFKEKVLDNNKEKVYLKVVDRSQKILVVAENPSPDLKYIRKILTENQAYNVEFIIESLQKPFTPKWSDLDLLIVHGETPEFLSRYESISKSKNISVVMFSGLSVYNGLGIKMGLSNNGVDNVSLSLNNQFKNIQLENDINEFFSNASPIMVPFGDITTLGNTQTIGYQKVGSIVTNKPLITISQQSNLRSVRVLGNGWWKARLRNHDSASYFDSFFSKIFEYTLTNKLDKKLVIRSVKDQYNIDEQIKVDIKLYDDLGEQLLGERITMSLLKADKPLKEIKTIVNSDNFQYNLSSLDSGVYTIKANYLISGKKEVDETQFSVTNITQEGRFLTPKHSELKSLVKNHNGFFKLFDTGSESWVENKAAVNKIVTIEDVFSIIEYKWLLFLILFIAFFEWILRKVKMLD